MNWFWFALIALFCWSGSDLFSKLGCCDENDRTSHLKMVIAVGLVMGLHAAFEILVNGVRLSFSDILTYLPASLLYILSLFLGYIGLRYIELSVSSPICNTSGAVSAILCFIFLQRQLSRFYFILNIFCLIWSVGHAFSAICLPMIFKYGSEKGRVMYIAVVVVFCVAFVNFGGYDFSEVSQLSGAFAVFAENPIYMVVLAVIAAVLFLGSMKLSEQFYMKREL